MGQFHSAWLFFPNSQPLTEETLQLILACKQNLCCYVIVSIQIKGFFLIDIFARREIS